jgi:hypothetical protein
MAIVYFVANLILKAVTTNMQFSVLNITLSCMHKFILYYCGNSQGWQH